MYVCGLTNSEVLPPPLHDGELAARNEGVEDENAKAAWRQGSEMW